MQTDSTNDSESFYKRLVREVAPSSLSGGSDDGLSRLGSPNPGRRLMVVFAMCKHLVETGEFETMRPPPFPDRPADLPDDDVELHTVLRRARARSQRMPEDERTVVREFDRWRADMQWRENASYGHLKFLVSVCEDLETIGDVEAMELRTHLVQHMGAYWPTLNLDEVPPVPEVARRELYLKKTSSREDLLPGWLMYNSPPPRFDPKAYEPEDEDDSGERRYWDD